MPEEPVRRKVAPAATAATTIARTPTTSHRAPLRDRPDCVRSTGRLAIGCASSAGANATGAGGSDGPPAGGAGGTGAVASSAAGVNGVGCDAAAGGSYGDVGSWSVIGTPFA